MGNHPVKDIRFFTSPEAFVTHHLKDIDGYTLLFGGRVIAILKGYLTRHRRIREISALSPLNGSIRDISLLKNLNT